MYFHRNVLCLRCLYLLLYFDGPEPPFEQWTRIALVGSGIGSALLF